MEGKGRDPALCPSCGARGIPVTERTLRHALKKPLLRELREEAYRFCPGRGCNVVYFSQKEVFGREDVRVRVGTKEAHPSATICYCFDVARGDIEDEVKRKGRSTFSSRIREEVEKGNCACEVRNPSGRCCLRDIMELEKGLTGTDG